MRLVDDRTVAPLQAGSGPGSAPVDQLAEAIAGATRLVDSDWWRLRVGDLRLVYAIDDSRRLVIILRAARRNESTYRRG